MKKTIFGVFLIGIILTAGGWRVFAEGSAGGTELKQGQQAFGRKAYSEAFKWFRQAAEKGDATAQSFLGYLYVAGLGVAKDPQEALKWLQKAAEAGNPEAQYNLGSLYGRGMDVGKNDKEAFKWYLKAAEQDLVDAEVAVALMYKKGTGVEQNFEEAEKWFRKAAEAGNDIALSELGVDRGRDTEGSRSGPQNRTNEDESRLKQEAGYKAPGYSGGAVPHSPAHPSAPRHR